MTEQTGQVYELPIDVEHSGIRVALLGIIIGSFVVFYVAASLLFNLLRIDITASCLAFAVAVAGSMGTAALAEQRLQKLWPSGRAVVLSDAGLELRDQRKKGAASFQMPWDQRINVLAWRFTVDRRTAHVQRGAYMLAVQLLQDQHEIAIYTFMPAKEAEQLPRFAAFGTLMPRAKLEKAQLTAREASEQRRLFKAEDARWRGGAEIQPADFKILVTTLNKYVAEWQRRAE